MDAASIDWAKSIPGVTEVLQWEPLTTGNSRRMWKVALAMRDGTSQNAVIRADLGGGPLSNTSLSLEREVEVYEALKNSNVPVPTILHSGIKRFAMTWSDGSPRWDETSLSATLRALRALHAIDPGDLPLAGWGLNAFADIEEWVSIAKSLPADPLLKYANNIILEAFPGEPSRKVLCHGDVGPGNILFDNSAVAAMLDWELAHIGDPMDDLAWLSVRTRLFGQSLNNFAETVRSEYALEVDFERFRYYRAVVLWRCLIICMAALAHPEGDMRLVQIGLAPALRAMLISELRNLGSSDPTPLLQPVPFLKDPKVPEFARMALSDVAAALERLKAEEPHHGKMRDLALMQAVVSQLATIWDRVPPSKMYGAANASPEELEYEARRQLALFPRAARLVSEPLPDL